MRTRKTRPFFLLFFLILFLFFSCDTQRIYEEYLHFENHQWHKDKVLVYEYDSDSIYAKAIKFSVNIRNDASYAYRNIWMFLKIELPTGTQISDTLNFNLMDEKGNWLPFVSGGTIKESKHYYKFAISNPPKGKYIIKLQHAMREEVLSDVEAVGVRIEKLE